LRLFRLTTFTAVLFSLCIFPLLAQQESTALSALKSIEVRQPERPAIPPPRVELGSPLPDAFVLPPLDRTTAVSTMPDQVGVRRMIDPEAMESAHWYPLPDGRWVWSMRFESPSAVGLRVHFDRFSVGNGRVWVLDGAIGMTKFFGPYTGTGPLQSGEFWTEILFSDTVEIEYVPENGSPNGQVPFHLVSLSHLWDVHKLTSRAAAAEAATANYSCFLDATCYPADQAAEAATLQLGVEQPSGENQICSGTLIRTVNKSGLPYVLTAGHCVSHASTAASMVAIWNYQSSSCNGPASAPLVPQQPGGTLLSYSAVPFQLDYAFVKLAGLPAGIVATYSGWNSNAVATNEQVVSMSHPQGLPTKYALGIRNSGGDDDSSYDITFSMTGLPDEASSGSGLFETDVPGAFPLMGAASGAQFPAAETGSLTVCDIVPAGAPLEVFYTKFTAIYPHIEAYLNDSVAPGGVTFTANPNPIPAAGQKTTLSWNAPGYSDLVIRINSPTGDTMTGKLGSSGSVTTGTWVTDGMQFFLVDVTSGASLASVVVHVNGSGGGGGGETVTFTANPNPIAAAGEKTTLTWNAPGHSSLVIRINSPTGDTMTGKLGSIGSVTTGSWVTDGMQFFLVALTSGVSLASVVVHVSGSGGGGGGIVTLSANPNPIPAAGEKTNLTWNAPGHSSVEIRINSPTGAAMTGALGSEGSVTTGSWVADGMRFFLVDLISGASLASVEVHVGAGNIYYSNFGLDGSFSSTAWCVSGSAAIGCGPTVVRQIAVPFTPNFTFTLHGISLPLSYSGGDNNATISLLADSGGLPGNTLDSWVVSNLPSDSPPSGTTTVLDTFNTMLQAGQQYWVEVQAFGDTLIQWYENGLGFTGGMENNGSGWQPLSGAGSLPAFSVTGLQ
jgi:hypothetical protein